MWAPAGRDGATVHKGKEPVVVAPSQWPKRTKETRIFNRRRLNPWKQANTKKQWKRAATLEHRAKGPTKSRQKEAKWPGERRMRGLLQKRLRSGATASDRVPTFTRKRTGHHHTPAVLARLEVPVHLVVPRTSRCVLDVEGPSLGTPALTKGVGRYTTCTFHSRPKSLYQRWYQPAQRRGCTNLTNGAEGKASHKKANPPPLTTSSEEHSSGADSMKVCAADTEETGEFAASGKPPKSPVTAPNPVGRGKGARHPVVGPGKGT
ncbi:hypothetical protein HPB50_028368 [Hyalomma asiaticum]|nr:hypothetical protein HPB50_028368 [Hyalomma asiaticum]